MIYALLAIICFIIVGIINRKIKKAKKEEEADSRGIYDEKHGHNKWFKLEEAAKYYNYQFEPHGALEDCKATLFVLKKLQGIEN